MVGPILLLILFGIGFALVKYRVQVRDFFAGAPAITPAVAGAGAPATGPAPGVKWYKKPLGIVAIVIGSMLAVALCAWGFTRDWGTLRVEDVNEWRRQYWFIILVVIAVAALATAIAAWGKPWMKVVQWSLLATVLLLFIGLPIGLQISEEVGGVSRAACGPFSPDETRICVLTEDWSRPITADRQTSEGEYEFCVFTPDGVAKRQKKLIGPNTYQYRSTKGALPIRYRLFRGGCPKTF